MTALSKQDLRIILNLAAHMSRVDREMAIFEVELLDRIAEAAELDDVEKTGIENSPADVDESLAGLSGPRAKEILVKTLCAVAYADGKQHPAEVAFAEEVNAKLGNAVTLLPWDQWESYILEVVTLLNEIAPE